MSCLDWLSRLFSKRKPKVSDYFSEANIIDVTKTSTKDPNSPCDNTCGLKYFCGTSCSKNNCDWIIPLPEYDNTKESILIIDDSRGVISFMVDDVLQILGELGIPAEQYNILCFDGQYAAYHFIATSQAYKGLNITKAIIDITYDGIAKTASGNVQYNGVDVYEELHKYNPNAKFVFYTGNELNEAITHVRELVNKFHNIHGNTIRDYLWFKSSSSNDARREHFKEVLF